VLLGTLPYMSPEQLRGELATPAWDLWALAVTTHEMFTGQRPRGLAGGTPAAPLAPALAAFFAGALAEDPAARPGSPQAFEAALTGALASAAPGPERGPGPGPEVRLR
jgi:serine/threonine protein kinase